MSQHLTTDERGVIYPCPHCGTANRIAYARLAQEGRCGSCKTGLPTLNSPIEITGPEAFSGLVSQSPLPVVVDFWASWCGPCRMMAPEFAKAAAQAAGNVVFAKVNTDEQQQIAAQFQIQGIPAFALIKNGRIAAKTSGMQPAAQLLEWIRRASG
ncbi:MAG: thioredoxin [Polyangiaceae bacterium]|nr:thioredoxin [Polyangiaceae bacterium]